MTNHDDHTSSTPIGPDESSARRAKRFAAAGGAALVLALGGAGAAYAVGGSGADTDVTQYGTIVDAPAESETTESATTGVAGAEDCPEKGGSTPTAPGSGAASGAPSDSPDASTL